MADATCELFELRVLSGLHQGAALPLFGEQWCIGANPQAELQLYDPGVADRHALLRCTDARWTVQAQEGLVHDQAGAARARIADLAPDVEFAIGGIRLCVADARSAWMEGVPAIPGEAALIHKTAPPAGRWRKWLSATLATLLLALAGMTLLPSTSARPHAPQLPAPGDKRLLTSAREVHLQLVKMLIERELVDVIRLEVGPDRITLSGDVAREPLALVSRMLARFDAQFETPVVIVNNVGQISTELPFRIVQIIGGQRAHVVLADGRRLFFGDEIDGLRLTAIDNNRLLFDGKQRYEVSW